MIAHVASTGTWIWRWPARIIEAWGLRAWGLNLRVFPPSFEVSNYKYPNWSVWAALICLGHATRQLLALAIWLPRGPRLSIQTGGADDHYQPAQGVRSRQHSRLAGSLYVTKVNNWDTRSLKTRTYVIHLFAISESNGFFLYTTK